MVTATGLPVFCALHPDQVLGPGLEGVGDAEQGQAALGRRGVPPLGEGGGGGGHGGVDVLGPRHRGLEVLLAGARVDQHGRSRRPAVGT